MKKIDTQHICYISLYAKAKKFVKIYILLLCFSVEYFYQICVCRFFYLLYTLRCTLGRRISSLSLFLSRFVEKSISPFDLSFCLCRYSLIIHLSIDLFRVLFLFRPSSAFDRTCTFFQVHKRYPYTRMKSKTVYRFIGIKNVISNIFQRFLFFF